MTRDAVSEAEVAGVAISKPDKVLFPDDGITKLDLATYYAEIADVMLPHLRGRPINMERFPDGIDGVTFYEKRLPKHFPDWVGRVEVRASDGTQLQPVASNRRSLVHLAQQACLTPHTWLCRTASLEKPDQLIFDLDPSDDSLRKTRRATRLVGALLEELGLTTYLKTTGSRGYHVLVPLRPRLGFDEVRDFARRCAERLVDEHPDLLTLEHRKVNRGDRVYVDLDRNGYGQTAVPAYAVRGRPGAPVSTPITWDELSRVRPAQYTLETVRRRVATKGCPWTDVRRHAQGLAKADKALRASGR